MTSRAPPAAACSQDRGCITCSDEGLVLRVARMFPADGLAICVDPGGRETEVQVALVGPISVGDELLVHAGVALLRLDAAGRGAA